MSLIRFTSRVLGLAALSWAAGDPLEVQAQLPAPQSYSDYYNQELQQLGRPDTSTHDYTLNRYYYHNPAVSPYMNLLRSPGYGTDAYQQYVLPEEQRRANYEAKSLEARSPRGTGNAGLAPARGTPQSGAYQNHWYGSRQQMGL